MVGVVLSALPTLEALEIGVIVSAFLFGVFTVQTCVYYHRYPNERLFVKIVIALVWLLEFTHGFCITYGLYFDTVTEDGHPERLARTPNAFNASILIVGLCDPLIQAFFAYRVMKFSGKLYIPIVCWLLTTFNFVANLVAAAEAFKMVTFVQYEKEWGWLFITVLAVRSCVDVLIAGSLSFSLLRERDPKIASTRHLLDRLLKWTIQTCTTTSLAGIVTLTLYTALPKNIAWLSIWVFSTRLYSNSLVAILNARTSLRQYHHEGVIDIQMTTTTSSKRTGLSTQVTARPSTTDDSHGIAHGASQNSGATFSDLKEKPFAIA